MSATIAAALKKLAVYILTDKKTLKIAIGIILGVINHYAYCCCSFNF